MIHGQLGYEFESQVGQPLALSLLRLFDVLIKTFLGQILLGGDWLEFLFEKKG